MDETIVSNETRLWFDIYTQANYANAHLAEGVEKMDRGQLQAVTTSIFIQSNMNGVKAEPQELPQKDGYPENMPTERNWDGSKVMKFGKHKGSPFSEVPTDYLVWMVERHDPKYPNEAEFELNRRTDEDMGDTPF